MLGDKSSRRGVILRYDGWASARDEQPPRGAAADQQRAADARRETYPRERDGGRAAETTCGRSRRR